MQKLIQLMDPYIRFSAVHTMHEPSKVTKSVKYLNYPQYMCTLNIRVYWYIGIFQLIFLKSRGLLFNVDNTSLMLFLPNHCGVKALVLFYIRLFSEWNVKVWDSQALIFYFFHLLVNSWGRELTAVWQLHLYANKIKSERRIEMFGQATKRDAKINQIVRMLKNRWIIVDKNILPLANLFKFNFLRCN